MQSSCPDVLSHDYFSPTKEAQYLETVVLWVRNKVTILTSYRNGRRFLKTETVERLRREIHENLEIIFLFKSWNNQSSKKFHQTMKAILRRINLRKNKKLNIWKYVSITDVFMKWLRNLPESESEIWFILSFLNLYWIKWEDIEAIILKYVFNKKYLNR